MQSMTVVAAALALTAALALPAAAQTASTEAFTASCLAAGPFLIGEVPAEVDAATILTPLCSCLVAEFSGFPQAEIDVLAADLAGTSTEESHAAFGDYEALEDKARAGLTKCFDAPEVRAALDAAAAPATTQ